MNLPDSTKADPKFTPDSPHPLASFEREQLGQVSEGDIERAIDGAGKGLRSYLRAKLWRGRRDGI